MDKKETKLRQSPLNQSVIWGFTSLLILLLCNILLTAQTEDQQISNLSAFAKAYGYVKYFHPSDEAAELNWTAFAAYGTDRVKAAKSIDELKTILIDLFQPLGPSLRIHKKDEPCTIPLFTFKDKSDIVAWQHYGNGLDNSRSSLYQSVRINRPPIIPKNSFGPIYLYLDAQAYRGKTIRLSAQVKADVTDPGSSARLWLRVDRKTGAPGFFDNMENRPICDPSWKRYEIEGKVDEDAKNMVLGAMLSGKGQAGFDQIQLFYQTGETWTEIPLSDGDFEQAHDEEFLEDWSKGNASCYQYRVVQENAPSGKQSLLIQDKSNIPAASLFDTVPVSNEIIHKELTPGLTLSFLLTLPKTKESRSQDQAKALERLKQNLSEISNNKELTEPIRLGSLIIAWNNFQHFYPYFDVVGVDWDKVLTQTLKAGLHDTGPLDHGRTLKKMVARLKDGHGVVYFNTPNEGDLPARFDWIEDRLVVTATQDDKIFQRGDIIVRIGGLASDELLKEAESQVSGSDVLRRHRALNVIGFGPVEQETSVELIRNGKPITLSVKRIKPLGNLFFKRFYEFNHPGFEDLGDGIYYLNASTLEKKRFDSLLPQLAQAKGIIIDMRPTGMSQDAWDPIDILPYLATEPYTSAHWKIPQITHPDQEQVTYSESRWPPTSPKSPHIKARVLIINVPSVVSYGESFMAIFEQYKLAEFVGEPTAGCNGNINFCELPGGYRIMWTGMKVVKHDGSQHHLIGIQPTYPVMRTLKAVKEGRDEFLDKALEVLKF